MSNKGMLWWAVDQESGSFASLPAGPMLIPALLIYGLLRLFHRSTPRFSVHSDLLPDHVLNSNEYRKDCARYRFLRDQSINHGLDPYESLEFNALQYPRWFGGKQFPY
jgi:hypothetical protein